MGQKTNTMSPIATPGPLTTMWSTAGAEKALAASGAYTFSDVIVPCAEERIITLLVAYDSAAAGGYPVIIPLGSCATSQPAAGDDSWFILPASDGTWTNTVLAGAVPSGADWTQNPGMGLSEVRGIAIKPMAAAVGTSDEVRIAITLNIAPFRYFQFAIAEVGNTGSPGACLINASLSV
jgi:hypothetical protein